jgi:predicted lipoprotein with Yx(FWY)xxD motif
LAILVKYLELIFFFYYQHYFRGDYTQVAKQVIMQSKGFPLYSNDDVATGLSVTAKIDNLSYPHPPVQAAQFAKGKDYFVIYDQIDPTLGRLYKRFKLGKQGTELYLLCQGKACHAN